MAQTPEVRMQYQPLELKLIWAALQMQETSLVRAARKARDDGKEAIADAIMAEAQKVINLKAHTQMLQSVK